MLSEEGWGKWTAHHDLTCYTDVTVQLTKVLHQLLQSFTVHELLMRLNKLSNPSLPLLEQLNERRQSRR